MNRTIRFESFAFDPESGELRKNGRTLKLHPQPAELLALLARRPGEVIGREAIQKALWSDDTVVDFDTSINSCIRQIRTALEDDAENPRYIETIPKKGYRFIGEKAGAQTWRWWAAAGLLALTAVSLWIYLTPGGGDAPPPRVIPLTAYPGLEKDPAVSPDGNQVAFVWNGGDDGGRFDLYVQLIDGDQPLQLTRAEVDDYSPAWSPDGRRIAFLREFREAGKPRFSEVMIIPALGGQETKITQVHATRENGPYFNPGLSWSPDGKYLATAEKNPQEDRNGVILISMESGEKKRLSNPETTFLHLEPVFSPDGRAVAYLENRYPTVGRVRIVSLDSTNDRVLLERPGYMTDLDWTPDGKSVVFSLLQRARVHLWKASVDGGVTTALPFGEWSQGVSISRSAGILVYSESHRNNCEIWKMRGPAATNAPPAEKVISSSYIDWAQQISPDGTRVAFLSGRSGGNAVWVCDFDGTNCSRLTEQPCGVLRWSPDSRWIAYTTHGGSTSDIYVVSAEGGAKRRITHHDATDIIPSWSNNGQWLYFNSNRSGEEQIWKIPFEGGEAQQVTTGGARDCLESSDGRFLYFTRRRESASYKYFDIYKVPVSGGAETPVLQGLLLEQLNWTIWDNDLVYRTPARESRAVRCQQKKSRNRRSHRAQPFRTGDRFLLRCNRLPRRSVADALDIGARHRRPDARGEFRVTDTGQSIRFDHYILDIKSGELTKDGRAVKLHPQPAVLLVLLAKRAGEVVGREEIQQALWSDDTVVDFDTSINSCIRQIRTALEDDAESPRYIETVPKKGYRFIRVAPERSVPRRRGVIQFGAIVVLLAVGALLKVDLPTRATTPPASDDDSLHRIRRRRAEPGLFSGRKSNRFFVERRPLRKARDRRRSASAHRHTRLRRHTGLVPRRSTDRLYSPVAPKTGQPDHGGSRAGRIGATPRNNFGAARVRSAVVTRARLVARWTNSVDHR